jgi:hypothetical protein
MTNRFRAPKPKGEIKPIVQQQILELDTAPLRDLLAMYLSAAPDLDTLKHWAASAPDKYAQSIMNICRCAGLIGKEAPTVNVTMNFNAMSDSAIREEAARMQRELIAKGLLPHLEAHTIEDAVLIPENQPLQ